MVQGGKGDRCFFLGWSWTQSKLQWGQQCPGIWRVHESLKNHCHGCWKPADPGSSSFIFCLLPVFRSSSRCGNKVLVSKYKSGGGTPSGLWGPSSATHLDNDN